MTFFYPLKNKHAFGIFDKVTKRKKVKQSTYGARRLHTCAARYWLE